MNNADLIKRIIYIFIALILAAFIINFILWLLPVILVVIVAYYIYKNFFKKEDKVLKGNKRYKNK